MYSRKAFDTFSNIPSSMEVIQRRTSTLRTVDLRSLDDAARRGAYENINKPINKIPFNKRVEVIRRVIGPDRATDFMMQCKTAEYIKRKELIK